MYSVGIDIGYSAFKAVVLNKEGEIVENTYTLHKGRIKETVEEYIEFLEKKYSGKIHFGGATGQSAKALTNAGGIRGINEVTALVEGSVARGQEVRSVIEIGGQSSKYITGLQEKATGLTISINSNCSAGTGSFLEEQVSRLGMALEEYAPKTEQATEIPRIAGRCSVFAKTDIIHHQQEGQSVENILLGLAYALVKNYRANVIKKHPIQKPILLAGGVAKNQAILDALQSVLKMGKEDFILPDNPGNISALGAAILALREKYPLDLMKLAEGTKDFYYEEQTGDRIVFDPLRDYGIQDGRDKHRTFASKEGTLSGYLGLDVGSTSTNVLLMDEEQRVISYQYLRTKGDPGAAVSLGIEKIKEEVNRPLEILGIGATGSGRHLAGKMVDADVIVDEITAQAKGAWSMDPEVDTIMEIGGQDSKFVKLKDGGVVDFEMNKICAAGTGSFIEEQAKKLDIPIEAFGDLALRATRPVDLGDRCTVFIESNIAAALGRREKTEDIAAGLSYSIANNYLNKVVGNKPMGKKIFFQGGVAHNQAVVNAFRSILKKPVEVPPYFSVTGAYGAAVLAREGMESATGNLDKAIGSRINGSDPDKVISSRKNGSDSNKEISNSKVDTTKKSGMLAAVEKCYLQGYEAAETPGKKTVGIPRVLFLHKLFPLFNTFFKELGMNVLLSDNSNENTVEKSQEYSLEETCYPIKLINGHVAELMEKEVDYIFLPSLHTMAHPVSTTRQNYGCVYMQCAPKLVEKIMEPEKKGIRLLTPELSFHFGKQYMMKVLMDLGEELGKNKLQTGAALAKGMMRFKGFEKQVEALGEEAVRGLKKGEKAFVIVTRAYGITDPVLNMGIPEKLEAMGHKVLTLSNLPAHDYDTSEHYPNMYWPFGQHILTGIRIIKNHPNLYPIYLTNHGCGPDTALLHLVKDELGEKPFLHLEVDEHCSSVGVVTRLEAFINSLKAEKSYEGAIPDLRECAEFPSEKTLNMEMDLKAMDKKTTWYLPYLENYSELLEKSLERKGYSVKVLPKTTRNTLAAGRKKTLTKEYLTFTALLGDVLETAAKERSLKGKEPIGFILPTTEGSEAGGQYHQIIRGKLDENDLGEVRVLAPFVEDLIKEADFREELFQILLAGDLIHRAPRKSKEKFRYKFIHLIETDKLTMGKLEDGAKEIRELHQNQAADTLQLIGDPGILFNPLLNNQLEDRLENNGFEIKHQPLSEYLWFYWKDFLSKGKRQTEKDAGEAVQMLENLMERIHYQLDGASPFEKDLKALKADADQALKYYAGGNGRYRLAKARGAVPGIQGRLIAASMYENTNTILSILQENQQSTEALPVLGMTFDGNENETDRSKLESFMYYALKDRNEENKRERRGA